MPTEYRLTEAFFHGFRRRLILRMVPLLLVALIGGWYAAGADTNLTTLLPFTVLVLGVLIFTVAATVRRQVKSLRTLRIELTDHSIARVQEGLPKLELVFAEISEAREVPGKGITLKAPGVERMLFLPATLEHFDDLRGRLAGLRPLEPQPAPRGSFAKLFATALLPIAAIAVVYRSESPAYVLPAGAFLIIVMIVCDHLIRRSPHLDQRVKKSRLGFILVCLSVAAKMWFTATR